MKIWFRYLLQLFKEGCVGNFVQFLQHELRWAQWRVPLIQVPGWLRLVVRLSWGALHCCGLCWTAVHAKFGIDMVVLGEPWTTRSSNEGCTGPGRKRSRSKPPFLTVVGITAVNRHCSAASVKHRYPIFSVEWNVSILLLYRMFFLNSIKKKFETEKEIAKTSAVGHLNPFQS